MNLILLDVRGMVIQSVAVMTERAALPFFKTIVNAVQKHPPARVLACWDRKPEFKISISETYKQARREKPKADEWAQEIGKQCDLALELLHLAGVDQFWADGYEADDVIYTLTNRLSKTAGHIFIITRDRDLYQLVGDGVSLILPQGIEADRVYVWEQTGGVEPGEYVDYLALCGCRGDGVRGLRGIGPKKAVDLIRRYGTVGNMLAQPELKPYKLSEGWKAQLEEAHRLVSLYDTSAKMTVWKGEQDWWKFTERAAEAGVPNLARLSRFEEIQRAFS